MGLILGYEKIQAHVRYSINFENEVAGEVFESYKKSYSAQEALDFVRELESKGLSFNITRHVAFGGTSTGNRSTGRKIPSEEVTLERLEQIAEEGEKLPIHEEPIVNRNGEIFIGW
jgi:hypothetical protein